MLGWCPGPESNRHGVTPEGFSYPLRFTPLRSPGGSAGCDAFGVWTLPLPCRDFSVHRGLGRGRQVSTLSAQPCGRSA